MSLGKYVESSTQRLCTSGTFLPTFDKFSLHLILRNLPSSETWQQRVKIFPSSELTPPISFSRCLQQWFLKNLHLSATKIYRLTTKCTKGRIMLQQKLLPQLLWHLSLQVNHLASQSTTWHQKQWFSNTILDTQKPWVTLKVSFPKRLNYIVDHLANWF